MSVKITAFACDHCGRVYKHRSSANRHEVHCWSNPNRCPREGELHGLAHKGDLNGKPRPWEPDGVGLVYLGGQWVEAPGYTARVQCPLYGDDDVECWRSENATNCEDHEDWHGLDTSEREWRKECVRVRRNMARNVTTGTCWMGP